MQNSSAWPRDRNRDERGAGRENEMQWFIHRNRSDLSWPDHSTQSSLTLDVDETSWLLFRGKHTVSYPLTFAFRFVRTAGSRGRSQSWVQFGTNTFLHHTRGRPHERKAPAAPQWAESLMFILQILASENYTGKRIHTFCTVSAPHQSFASVWVIFNNDYYTNLFCGPRTELWLEKRAVQETHSCFSFLKKLVFSVLHSGTSNDFLLREKTTVHLLLDQNVRPSNSI